MGFIKFNLSQPVMTALTQVGYAEPTPIQARAIPEALLGHDLQACAQTGTGKTCAFVVPILEKILKGPRSHSPKALILTPTRELAAQVDAVVKSLATLTSIRTALVLGGANFSHQARQIKSGPEIIVATPGRLIDHIERRTISLAHVNMLVLDEADRMLDMGFLPTIRRIVATVPRERQSLLFSATFGHEIQGIVKSFLKNPIVIELARSQPSQNVTQMAYPVPRAQKLALLQALLELHSMTSALIFTRTKHGANRLARSLEGFGKSVALIHGNRSQSQRQQALQGFKDRRYQILVATDIAARGIDVKNISHVINFDVPLHAEDYVHRIGRTGRATAVGEAFTLVSPEEAGEMRDIERLIGKQIPRTVIPDFPYNARPQVFPSGEQISSSRGRSHKPHSGKYLPGRHPSTGRFPGRPPIQHGRPPQEGGQSRPQHAPRPPERKPNPFQHNKPSNPSAPAPGRFSGFNPNRRPQGPGQGQGQHPGRPNNPNRPNHPGRPQGGGFDPNRRRFGFRRDK